MAIVERGRDDRRRPPPSPHTQNVVMALLMVRYHLAQKSHSSLLLTMDMLRVATQIYPTSGLVLFCLMGTAVNMNYGAIYEAIDVYWR